MKKILLVFFMLSLLVAITACSSQNIVDVKNPENIGKSVTISGTVETTIKIGSLSGYTIKDSTDSIGVSSEALPKEGDAVTIRGVLMKDTIFGYYIKANE